MEFKLHLQIDESICLKSPDLKYTKDLFEIVNQQSHYLGEWLEWVPRINEFKHAQDFIYQSIRLSSGGQQLVTFIFWNQHLIGAVSLVRINRWHQNAELGYWIHKDWQGQGIVTRSCAGLINYVFDNLELNRLYIYSAALNKPGIAIPQKLGFKNEGVLRQAVRVRQKFVDVLVFGLLKEEWLNKKL